MLYIILGGVSVLFLFTTMFNWRSKWNPSGKYCYITGGSRGLGLALALALTKRGANVTVVARDPIRLQNACEQLEAAKVNEAQIINWYACSLHDATQAAEAYEFACSKNGGKSPDAVFLSAGVSTPGFFLEETEVTMRGGMDNVYWVAAWTALEASKRMVRDNVQGKIVFVSSMLGYFGLIGYSTYSPAKHALRGLADTLRSEMVLYNIGIHIFFPGNIDSPGYAMENQVKPAITLKIEESDKPISPEKSAIKLLKGVENGDCHISDNILGELFRASTRGSTPYNNILLDSVYSLIGSIGIPLWRQSVDREVANHREEHNKYLRDKKFFSEQ